MRVSVVNPTKKARKAGKRKMSPAQKAAALKNLAKARRAKKAKSSRKASKPKKGGKKKGGRKKARKSSKPKVGRKTKRKTHKKSSSVRKARKGKSKKSSKRKGKSKRVIMPKGKRVRPAMYVSKKSKRVTHSPKSKYAKKGYRFNPSLKGISGKHMVNMKGFRFDIPHAAGAVGGFAISGYVGGQFGMIAKQQFGENIMADGVSLVGNVVGTEIPAMLVHWGLPKVGMGKYAVPVARGMRIGGYVAAGLNAVGIVLRALNVNVPFRELSPFSEPRDFILSGIGDIDLALGGFVTGNGYDDTMDYAALDIESSSLDDEIDALSAYIDPNDEWAGVSNDDGLSP